ncbi:hypothetical protein [Pedobacter gandavensis]|uniref:hypothetical protein n=1 Tax=Pedobacter gandavensis TaxID=2679963 RepID=UPI00292FE69A|nr:hypothetical protein [Pedobacter gandavensis]
MMAVNQVIPCPVCKAPISFDVKQLIQGINFSCATCGAGIGLAVDSKIELDEARQKIEMLKDMHKK